MRVATGVLMDRDQAGHAAAADIFRSHGVARTLGRDHEHVDRGLGLDEVEMDVEAMCEGHRRAVADMIADVGVPDAGLMFVGGEDHDDVRPGGGILGHHHLEARALGLLRRGRTGTERDHHLADPRIPEVLGMGMALAAIAHDRDLLCLDQALIGIGVVIDAHSVVPSFQSGSRQRKLASREGERDARLMEIPACAGMTNLCECLRQPRVRGRSRRRRCGRFRPGPPRASARRNCRFCPGSP